MIESSELKLISAAQFSTFTSLSYQSLRRAVLRGELHAIRFGSSTRYDLEEIQNWVAAHAQQAEQPTA